MMFLLLKYRFATSFGLRLRMAFGHSIKWAALLNTMKHTQKHDLGNLVKALAPDSTEYSHFKNGKEDGLPTTHRSQQDPHKRSPEIIISLSELPHSRLSKGLS